MRTLEETLLYRNPRVVDHFRSYYFGFSLEDANEIFIEMLRWLWLCAKAHRDRKAKSPSVPKTMNIQSGMIAIDVLWHIFIIHTRDYASFCFDHFDDLVHHSPANPDFTPPTQAETELQMSYIYDHGGGEATLLKWYVEFVERFPVAKIRELQKPFTIDLLPSPSNKDDHR